MSDPYSILGVARDASDDQIKSAFRKLAMENHPDRNPNDPSAAEKFQKISSAYETLKDPQKRAAHDNPQPQQFHFRTGGFPGGFPGFGFEDIMRDFMAQQRPQNRSFNIGCQIGLMEAFRGCEVSFEVAGKNIRVQIPKGVDNGNKIRVQGAGETHVPGAPPGDVFVIITVNEHPIFKRNGKNIFTTFHIDTLDAILGTTVKVETIDGDFAEIEIPPLTQNNHSVRIHKRGMPVVNTADERGDHIVSFDLITPSNLSDEQIALIRQVKDLQK